MYSIVGVDDSNRHQVNRLRAGPAELPFLHYNAHWYGMSCLVPDIWSHLILRSGAAVGFLAWGTCYEDEYCCEHRLEAVAELYHLVIVPVHQRAGIGRWAVAWVVDAARAAGFTRLRVAHAAENVAAAAFWPACGFRSIGVNYDGDDYRELPLHGAPPAGLRACLPTQTAEAGDDEHD